MRPQSNFRYMKFKKNFGDIMEEYELDEHYKAIMRGVDITQKWYAIVCFLESKETEIKIENIKMRIGEMCWNREEERKPIYAHKDGKSVYFSRTSGNNSIEIQHQLQNMYIHGDDYTIKIDKTIDTIYEELSKTEVFCEYWGYIHCCFMNGTIENFV